MSARAAAAAADAEKKAAAAAAAAKQAALAANAEHKARVLKAKIDADAGWQERLRCAGASNLMRDVLTPFSAEAKRKKEASISEFNGSWVLRKMLREKALHGGGMSLAEVVEMEQM
jgi:hypothetical protein